MKKSLVIIAIAFSIISCNKTAEVASTKTAYVDTSKLMIEYIEAKDIEAKYKAKSQEMGRELEAEIAKFKVETISEITFLSFNVGPFGCSAVGAPTSCIGGYN
jgi:outer membrane protein